MGCNVLVERVDIFFGTYCCEEQPPLLASYAIDRVQEAGKSDGRSTLAFGATHREAVSRSVLLVLVVPVLKRTVDILDEEDGVARNAGYRPLEIGVIHAV
jgi:hypothetical protein